jgi:eukaryotic-like serine/threonine-protein kinase
VSGEQAYAVASVPPGYRVGPWTVERPLGAGAFGHVYAAAHEDPGAEPARAALKFLPTGTHTPRQLRHLRELAEREVALLSRLRSPRLIRMHEVLTVDAPDHPELDGASVLVLEEARGSLDALLAAGPPREGPALLVQICEGLHQLHGAGWVHGDLKPGNVLLMADGTARLGDFNLAAEMEGTHAYSPAFTTADYTPPELLWSEVGERGIRIRPTADIWAFGVLAHLVLTGSYPLPGGTPAARRDAAVRHARGEEELRLSARLPAPWRELVRDCLARTHEERAPHDAASLLRRASEAAAGVVARRRRVRRPLLAVAAGVVALAVTGLGVRALLEEDTPPAPGKPAATGYDRCVPGDVCFFSEPDGKGAMCSWEGDDTDWAGGDSACSWASGRRPGSVFNNGLADPGGYVHVAYYAEPRLRQRLGCVEKGRRHNLAPASPVLSHTWTTTCSL